MGGVIDHEQKRCGIDTTMGSRGHHIGIDKSTTAQAGQTLIGANVDNGKVWIPRSVLNDLSTHYTRFKHIVLLLGEMTMIVEKLVAQHCRCFVVVVLSCQGSQPIFGFNYTLSATRAEKSKEQQPTAIHPAHDNSHSTKKSLECVCGG